MHLVSDSRATDGAVRALADAATVARDLESWLIIGGHMVNLHALRAGVDMPTRATRDADLAVDLLAVRSGGLLRRLDELGYRNAMSSNRFVRDAHGATATIDLLAPSYSTRHEPNVDAGAIVAVRRRLRTFFDLPGRALPTAASSKRQQVRLRALVRSLVGAD